MKKIVFLIFTFVLNQSYSQIDTKFQDLMSTAFEDERISKVIFDHNFIETGSAYVFMNKEFEFWITNQHTQVLNLPNWNRSMEQVFETDDFKKVFTFGGVIPFGAYTQGKVDTVVVFDKIESKNDIVNLSFHTTDLNSKKFYKRNGSTKKFNKVECQLLYKESKWLVNSVKVKNCTFKSILDQQ